MSRDGVTIHSVSHRFFLKTHPPSKAQKRAFPLSSSLEIRILYIESKSMGNTPRTILTLTYNEISRRLLLKQEPSEIAQAMCLREEHVQRVMRRPEFQEILQRLQDKMYAGVDRTLASDARDLRAEISQAAFASFDRLKGLLDTAASENTVVNIAQDLLDRAGYGKQTKIMEEHTIRIDSLDAEILAAALAREKQGRERLGDRPVDDLLSTGKAIEEKQIGLRDAGK